MTTSGDKADPPVPDPTVLTTEQLLREVETLREWVLALTGGLRDVTDERLKAVGTHFTLIERQRVEQKADTEKAVQAALSAAKEAVREQTAASDRAISKSETATAEQLRQLSTTFTTAIQSVTTTIGDLKDRVNKIENLKTGATEQKTSVYGLIAGAVGIITLVIIGANLLTSQK